MAVKRKQAPAKRARGASRRGTGTGHYTVKHKRATARQRRVIDGVLSQCEEDRCSRRVMVAAIMTITQESRAGEDMQMTGNDDLGIYQQGRNWISAAGAHDPHKSTHAFLISGPTSWRKVHGSTKKAPGNLSHAIHEVQNNADPNAYAPWHDEAVRTVDTWLGSGDHLGGGYYLKRYMFTRGEKGGQAEDSWDASARLVQEVGAFRWAAGNVLYAVSGDELRTQAPSLTIHGGEGWLRKEPAWSWASGRPLTEVTLEVLMDRWDVMPGGLVVLGDELGAMRGRWLVAAVGGTSLDSPEGTVTLHRPTRLKWEPAPEVAQHSAQGTITGEVFNSNGPRTVEHLRDVCKYISDHRSHYVYGGSHGPLLKKLKANAHMDCSSSVSLALWKAGFFPGDRAITSGEFARSWGVGGKGDEFTVWANGEHVWLEFHNGDRFDTSQHSGKSGPMYTKVSRHDQGRFTPRHARGH